MSFHWLIETNNGGLYYREDCWTFDACRAYFFDTFTQANEYIINHNMIDCKATEHGFDDNLTVV